MSNLRWLRLNGSKFSSMPRSMDCFSKLVSINLTGLGNWEGGGGGGELKGLLESQEEGIARYGR